MIWWLTQVARVRSEQATVANLQERVGWLKKLNWIMSEDFRVQVEIEVTVGSKDISLKMVYPAFFPSLPPQIYPLEKVCLSSHQYGVGGELCLEIRTDNWEPQMTGAMMIESAYRLLCGEQAIDGESGEVLDAHQTTIAQDVRGEFCRLLLSVEARQHLAELDEPSVTAAEFEELYQSRRCLARLSRIGDIENITWSHNLKSLNPIKCSGYILRLPSNLLEKIPNSIEEVLSVAQTLKYDGLVKFIQNIAIERFILFALDDKYQLLSLLKGKDSGKIRKYVTIDLPPLAPRQSAEYGQLISKSVALVGCGSVGSKIAASLARAGVGYFKLIDGDILFPGNIVRNDLDQRFVGLNKPDAVKARIQEINPSAQVEVRRILMGGQESSASTEAALNDIAKCDLIIDATANATAFNLCATVAQGQRKPLVWGEVFAGGIGGMIVRTRPDIDPNPFVARRQLITWCAEQNVPWNGKESESYTLSRDDAPPMVADDAEVTIIAAHMTRLGTDILVRQESVFPHSAYILGLREGWIFSAPFEACPIHLEPDGEWQQTASAESNAELVTLVRELLPERFGVKNEN